jgi:hypothetical protein
MENLPAIISLGVFWFAFPIGAAYYAFKKGYKGWAAVSIVSIFAGLGLFGGIAALIKARKPKEEGVESQNNPLSLLRWLPIIAALVSFFIVAGIGVMSTEDINSGSSIGAVALIVSLIVFWATKEIVKHKTEANQ